jgi:uncharacterized protein with von Willebrand factor type A (vWA) domain
MDIPKDWLTGKARLDKLPTNAVEIDRWDEDDLARMVNSVPPFAAARRSLQDFTPTGRPALNDVFFALLKGEPTLVEQGEIRPDHLVNRFVMEEVLGLDELAQLRHYSANDDVQAALSATVMEPDVEVIFDRVKKEREQAEQFQKTLMSVSKAYGDVEDLEHDLDEMMRQLTGEDKKEDEDEDEEGDGADGDEPGGAGGEDSDEEGEGDGGEDGGEGEGEGDADGDGDGQGSGGQPGKGKPKLGAQQGGGGGGQPQPGQGPELTDQQKEALDAQAEAIREAQERLEELQGQAQAEADQLEKDMEAQAPMVKALLTQALNKAEAEAEATNSVATTWGLEPGELQRLNAEERMELARRLSSDRFKRIADLFGPMRNIMFSEQARKTTNSREEIFDVETGNDLSHLLPSELLNLDDELTELDFLRRYSERSLMQYALQGSEKLARGGIIFCEDGSGSMSGEREMWAKAVMLCLLHLARQQHRTMHVFHFGSPGQIRHIPFVEESDFTLDRILEAAELFFNGGTDFVTPMKGALGVLQEEFAKTGGVRADVVFVTDDECWVDETFMTHYLDEMHRMDATTWGISVTGHQPSKDGALSKMCEGKTATVKDFASGGDVRDVFRTVT